MINSKILANLCDEFLKPVGFRKRNVTWHRLTTDVVQVFQLQKSDHGGQYYVNLAWAPTNLNIDNMPTPQEHKCPIRARLDALNPEHCNHIKQLFDLESKYCDSENARLSELSRLMESLVLGMFSRTEDVAALRALYAKGGFSSALISLGARRLLEEK